MTHQNDPKVTNPQAEPAAPTSPPTAPVSAADSPVEPRASIPDAQTWNPDAQTSTPSAQPWGPGAPATMSPSPRSESQRPFRPIGPLLILLGAVVAFISLTMRWSPEFTFAGADYGAFAYAKALQRDPAWTTTGVMLMIGLILVVVSAMVAVVVVLVHALTRSSSKALGWVVLGFAIAGLVASAATLIVSLIMGDGEDQQPAMWIFGLSFIPVVIGSVGILSRRY